MPSDGYIIDLYGYEVSDMGGVVSVTCDWWLVLPAQPETLNFLDVWLWRQVWMTCSASSSLQGSYCLKNVNTVRGKASHRAAFKDGGVQCSFFYASVSWLGVEIVHPR